METTPFRAIEYIRTEDDLKAYGDASAESEREAIVAWLREEAGERVEYCTRSLRPDVPPGLRMMLPWAPPEAVAMFKAADALSRGDHLKEKFE